jgi:hypothetical protein
VKELEDSVEICYLAMTSEDTAGIEDLVCAVVTCTVHELVITL